MLTLRFIPIFEDREFVDAVKEYETIWEKEGVKIIDMLKKITNLDFVDTRIAIVVYENMSMSGRGVSYIMKLRASYDYDTKLATLVHELSHRLLFVLKNKPLEDQHPTINFFLYDVWVELYGKDFADRMVDIEKERADIYKTSWEGALALGKDERKDKFAEYVKLYS
jgi:hypothetical protein